MGNCCNINVKMLKVPIENKPFLQELNQNNLYKRRLLKKSHSANDISEIANAKFFRDKNKKMINNFVERNVIKISSSIHCETKKLNKKTPKIKTI